MGKRIQLLDCTLRDGAYIVEGKFGKPAIKGIIGNLQSARVDIIECGWLKNSDYVEGSTYYQVPSDMSEFIQKRNDKTVFVAMIDWDRYDIDRLPQNDGKTIDAIRIVFPLNHYKEGIALCDKIREKGYQVYLQAAHTLGYSGEDLKGLIEEVNKARPVCISVVDTFGAMYPKDLDRILTTLEKGLDPQIKIGFHSHNNQQLSFALCMQFIDFFKNKEREIIVDASLCGMGRGAGNATLELVADYLNRECDGNYDLNVILDTIDVYMQYFLENFKWGYSIPYYIAGMYCCHVNNIAYLLNNHRTGARDMNNIIESLSPAERTKYDYSLLEERYLENQSRIVDDDQSIHALEQELSRQKILLIAPGKSTLSEEDKIKRFIKKHHPIVIGVNAVVDPYRDDYDYLFFVNPARYQYAKDSYEDIFFSTKRILLSNIKAEAGKDEIILNYNGVIKRGWEHFDNAVICCLRLMGKLMVKEIYIAGFDGFKEKYGESYADISLPLLNPNGKWRELNEEIYDMLSKFLETNQDIKLNFITESSFNK